LFIINYFTLKCNFIIHVITNPLFLGLYIPCKKVDTWWPPKIRDQVEQNRLLIIILQESHTWINFSIKIFLLNHTIEKLQKKFKTSIQSI